MERLTKGTIAAGAAVLLLLGGGGTLAYWNSTIDAGSPAVITAGNLALSQASAPAWTIAHQDGTATPVADISAVRIVPGDTLVFGADYTVQAQGQNLVVAAEVTPGAISPASASTADTALAARLTQSAVFTIDGIERSTATLTHRSNTAGTYEVSIEVALDWDFDGAPTLDNAAKGGQVDLSQFSVSVTQVDGSL